MLLVLEGSLFLSLCYVRSVFHPFSFLSAVSRHPPVSRSLITSCVYELSSLPSVFVLVSVCFPSCDFSECILDLPVCLFFLPVLDFC